MAQTHDMVLQMAHAIGRPLHAMGAPHRAMAQELTLRALALAKVLVELARCFADAHLGVIALKGPALSQELFGTPALRDPGDLDLLIRPADLAPGDALLRAAGYQRETRWDADFAAGNLARPLRRVFHVVYRHPTSDIVVELHWRWFHLEEIMPFNSLVIWQETRPMPLAGTPVTLLAPATQLLYLSFHAAKHECERLKWLNDLAWLLTRLDDRTVAESAAMAGRLGVLDLFLAPLMLVVRLGLAAMPASLEALQRRPATQRLAAKFLKRLQAPVSRGLMGTWRQRLSWHRTYWRLAVNRDHPRRTAVFWRLLRHALTQG